MEFSIKFDTVTPGWPGVYCPQYILRGHKIFFSKVLLSIKLDFFFRNYADPDEIKVRKKAKIRTRLT